MNIGAYYKDINTSIVEATSTSDKSIYSEESILKAAKLMLYNHYNSLSTITESDANTFRESRLYGAGKQSSEKYKNYIAPIIQHGKHKGKRKTMVNISWDVLPIMQRFKSKILGYLLKYDFFAECSATDPLSDDSRNELKTKLFLQMHYGEFMNEMKRLLQLPDDGQELPFQPTNAQEIEMMSEMGAFKLNQEIAMEMFVSRSYSMSNWDTIRTQIYNDLIDLGVVIIRDVLDPVTYRPKVQYCDPEFTIIQESKDVSGRNVTAAGEIKYYSAGELIKRYPNLPKEKFENLMANQYGVSLLFGESNFNSLVADKQLNKIAVFEFEYLTYDVKSFKKTKYPNYESVKETSQSNANLTTREPVWIEGVLLLGSDILLEGGKRKNAPYSYAVEMCRSSYSYFRVSDRSIVDICKATIDEIMLTIYKMRNANLKAKPKGENIDINALVNITLGGEKQEPLQILRILREEGDLLYKGRTTANGTPIAGSGEPVSERTGGIGPYLDELIKYYTVKVNELRDLTGLSNIVDSSNPNPEQLVGVAKIAQDAADDVLRPLITAYKINKKHVTENLGMRWQFLATFFPEKLLELSSETSKAWAGVLTIGSEMAYYKYGFNFDNEVNPNIINEIKQSALIALQGGQNQGPMINYKDYMYITKLIEGGQYKFAQMYLAYAQERKKKEDALAMQQNSADNAKANQMAEAAKADAITNQIQLQTVSELKKIETKGEQDRKTLVLEYQLKAKFDNTANNGSAKTA